MGAVVRGELGRGGEHLTGELFAQRGSNDGGGVPRSCCLVSCRAAGRSAPWRPGAG